MNQIRIRTCKGTRFVKPENIIRVEANSSYCKIFFDNEYPLTVAKLLRWFEENLPQQSFCRIHKTHLVNRHFITAVSEDHKLTLASGEQLQVSRRNKQAFQQLVA